MAYNLVCELKETRSRSKKEMLSGRTVAKFRAKVFENETSTEFIGTGQASNAFNKVLQFKYFGVKIVPQNHSIVIGDQAYIIVNARIINSPFSGKLINNKSIYRVVLN